MYQAVRDATEQPLSLFLRLGAVSPSRPGSSPNPSFACWKLASRQLSGDEPKGPGLSESKSFRISITLRELSLFISAHLNLDKKPRMNISQDKTTSLSEAVKKNRLLAAVIYPSADLTASRNPMAAVYEIIRQKINNIHLYAHSNGQGVDELIGAGMRVPAGESPMPGNGRSPRPVSGLKKPPSPAPCHKS